MSKLPSAAITIAHRADGSGTTFNFVNYLSKVSPEWRSKVGEGTAVEWPVGMGGKGNEGVAAFVMQTKNSIGYVEYAYALQNRMTYGLVQNKAGKFIKPDQTGFQAAAASADWTKAKDFHLIMTDAPGDEAYPIAATAFRHHAQDAEKRRAIEERAEVLPLGAGARPAAGGGTALRAAAEAAGRSGRSLLEHAVRRGDELTGRA